MTFPSFLTTGQTRDLTVQPLEHKAFNLMPLIQMLNEDGKKASTSAATTTAKTDDTKLEGRVGGVNQIMAEVNKYDNVIKNGINLMGDAFTGTPEYARAVRGREYALSEEVKNTLGRETKNLELFKEQIKGKGHFFHLPQYITTGVMKRVKDWQSVLEYGKSDDYYGYVGGEFQSNFDFTPVLPDIEDSRKAVDGLFTDGYIQGETGWTDVQERIVGNTVGVVTSYRTELAKRNFQRVDADGKPLLDSKGRPIDPPNSLEYSHNQALARALSGMDVTDPLSGGYFQNFLQLKAGNGSDPFKDYRNEKDIVTEEGLTKFFEDYSKHVQEDLSRQKNKRKKEEVGSTTKESFDGSEERTRALAAKKAAEMAAMAWIGLDQSHADIADFGMEAKWFEGGEGVDGFFKGLENKDAEYLYAEPWSPFYKQSLNGKTYYNINDNINWEKIKENIVIDATKRGITDPEKYANKILAKARETTETFEQLRKDGKTFKATGRYDSQAQYMRADQVPDWFLDAVNSKYLLGKDTQEMGVGMFAKIGDTYVMLNDIKGLKYAGSEGGVKMTSNTVPTNLYTRVIENGQTRSYQWASDEWRKMSPEQKDKIIALSKEQAKSNPMYGTMLLNGVGQIDNVIKKDRAVPMDEYSQKVLYALANEPGSSLNMIYASPAAYTVSGKFKGKTEADIAKAFKGVNIYAEMPATYLTLSDADKKSYQKVYSDMWYAIDMGNTFAWTEAQKNLNMLQSIKKHLTAQEYKEFETHLSNKPAGMKHNFWAPGNFAAYCADFAIGKKLNYDNRQTFMTEIPVSADGYTVTPIAKKQLTFAPYTEGTGQNIEKGFQVYVDFDATGVTLKNVTNPALTETVTTFNNVSQRQFQLGRGHIKEDVKNDRYSDLNPQNKPK